ncbi:SIS domain-containing protein [Cerasibacillus sp. JNUCC 74]
MVLPSKKKCIIFSYYRYTLDTIRLAAEAKKKGIKVIAFTDFRIALIIDFADVVIL